MLCIPVKSEYELTKYFLWGEEENLHIVAAAKCTKKTRVLH